ncbi:MAG: ABC transporter permease [Thermodesulfobacteriota bacterium]|nr:ABC transporter permease [Thermodesulfobacteriota bacterium]
MTGQYIIRRLLIMLPVLLGVSLIIFIMVRIIPGDPSMVMAGPHATKDQVEQIRTQLGLDRHPVSQYFIFIGNLFRGDLGTSTRTSLPVTKEIMARLPNTLLLALASILIATVLGVLTGIIAGVKQNSKFDYLSMLVALFGLSMPVFWLGLMLMLLFSIHLGWLPAVGAESFKHLILPAITLGANSMAIIARMTRSSMLEVIRLDYIRTARAKGLKEKLVISRHALKNALIPVVTVIGLQTGTLLGGAVLTEIVFAWPGVGRLLVEAILARDYPVVQGVVLLVATMFIFVNLVVDILYAYLDPRIRYQ